MQNIGLAPRRSDLLTINAIRSSAHLLGRLLKPQSLAADETQNRAGVASSPRQCARAYWQQPPHRLRTLRVHGTTNMTSEAREASSART